MLPVTLMPSTDVSASPFHRWNTEAEKGEEKCPHRPPRVLVEVVLGLRNSKLSPVVLRLRRGTGSIEKDRDVQREREICKETRDLGGVVW